MMTVTDLSGERRAGRVLAKRSAGDGTNGRMKGGPGGVRVCNRHLLRLEMKKEYNATIEEAVEVHFRLADAV